jgi:hypothetical protein
VRFDSKPYSNGKWEVTVDGWRFYHDPMTVDGTSGRELRKYMTGYPGGPDWSFALPEPFVAAYENRMQDERLWCEARHALDTKGWAAARAILEPRYGWPTREVSHLPREDHRRAHNTSFGGVRVDGCRWCAEDAEWDRRKAQP